MDEYLDVEEACVKGRSGQFVHRDMDGDREEGATCLTRSPLHRLTSSFYFDAGLLYIVVVFEKLCLC